jgi:hypothetical protein
VVQKWRCKMQKWRDVSSSLYCIVKVEIRAPHEAADDSADDLLRASCCVPFELFYAGGRRDPVPVLARLVAIISPINYHHQDPSSSPSVPAHTRPLSVLRERRGRRQVLERCSNV